LDIIYVDTPSGEVIEISSSSNLSVFSSGADPQCTEGVDATPMGSSSVSIGELWPDIDKLYEVNHGGTSTVTVLKVMPHEVKSQASAEKSDKYTRCTSERTLLNDAHGPSVALLKSHGKGSIKRKATQILFGAPEAILYVCESRLSIGNIHLRPV
jgi:hypothetical protein